VTQPNQSLRAKWRDQLRAAGFRDLAVGTYGDHGFLSNRGAGKLVDVDQARNRAAKIAYAEFAAEVSERFPFDYDRDHAIWRLHADGLGMREIARQLGAPENFHSVRSVVNRIRRDALAPDELPTDPRTFRRRIHSLLMHTDPRTLVVLADAFAQVRRSRGELTPEALAEVAHEVPMLTDLVFPETRAESNWATGLETEDTGRTPKAAHHE
jgi:hypothetical protein